MPYKIRKVNSGFKVTTPKHPQGFSKKPLTKKKAKKQLAAIKIHTQNESTLNSFDITANNILKTLIESNSINPNIYTVNYIESGADPYRERTRQTTSQIHIERIKGNGVKITDAYGREFTTPTEPNQSDVRTSDQLKELVMNLLEKGGKVNIHINGGLQPLADWWDHKLILLNGREVDLSSLVVTNIDKDAYISSGKFKHYGELNDNELEAINNYYPDIVNDLANQQYHNRQSMIRSSQEDVQTDKQLERSSSIQDILDKSKESRLNRSILDNLM